MTRRFDVEGGGRAADGQHRPVARSQHHRDTRRVAWGAQLTSSRSSERRRAPRRRRRSCSHAKFIGRCRRRSPPSQLYPYSTVNDGMLDVVPGEATGASLCWGEDWNWPMHHAVSGCVCPKI